jgi:hypothetical protein
MKKTDLATLKKLLADLKKEATHMGLPMARIRDVDDLQKTIELVEKKRG